VSAFAPPSSRFPDISANPPSLPPGTAGGSAAESVTTQTISPGTTGDSASGAAFPRAAAPNRLQSTQFLKDLDGFVESYRRGRIHKHRALFSIFAAISSVTGVSLDDREIALSYWGKEIDRVEDVLAAASAKGFILADASAKGAALVVAPPLANPTTVASRKRQRESSEDRDLYGWGDGDGPFSDNDEAQEEKPGKIDESELPWFSQELTAKATENPSISENH